MTNSEFCTAILEVACDGCWDWDMQADRVSVSRGYGEMSGYSPDETVFDSRCFREIVHPDDRDRVAAALEAHRCGKTGRFVAEYRMLTKTGDIRWVEERGKIVAFDEQGVPQRMVGTVVDISGRKRMQKEREQYVNFFRMSADLMCIVDPQGTFLKVNPAFIKALGYSEAELTAGSLINFIHPDDRQATLGEINWQQQGGFTDNFANRYICKDGSEKWLSWRAAYNGEDGLIYATARDITSQRSSEETLRSSRNLLNSILENIPIRVFWKDTGSRYLGCNSAFARDAGLLHAEELIGKDDFQLGWHEQAELYRADDKWVIDSGMAKIGIEEPQTTPDGRTIVLRTSKVPLFDGERIVGVLGIYEDITERKEAETVLREREEQLRVIFETCQAGIILVDPRGEILFANGRMAEMFGLPLEDLVGSFYPDHVHPGERTLGDERMRQLIRGEIQSVALERHYVRADGTDFWGYLSGRRLENPDGSLRALVGFIADVTEQYWARIELQKKNVEIEQFLYTVSHDLRSPLVTIKTFLGCLEEDLAAAHQEHVGKDLEFIHSAAGRMEILLNELLEISRVGRVETSEDVVKFTELVAETLEVVSGQIASRRIKVTVADAQVVLRGDHRRLLQIWQNLLDNAIKYMGDQAAPSIEIGVKEQPGETAFFVCDNGIGIAPEYQHKVFGMFEQLDSGSSGVGMGLALVKRIVELYGGNIHIESEGKGKGCCFWFTLPKALQ